MFEKIKVILLGGAVVIAVGAALYVGGYWYASHQFDAEKQQLAGQADAISVQVNRLASDNHLLHARLALYRAAGQLDQRNFGTANSHLHAASAALGQAAPDAVSDTAEFEALRSELAAINIQVAEDLEAQRSRVLEFGRRLDALLPSMSAEGAPAAAATGSPTAAEPPAANPTPP